MNCRGQRVERAEDRRLRGGVLGLVGVGLTIGIRPQAPSWWPLAEKWWLPGGWGVGVSLSVSGTIAAAMIDYGYLNFRDVKHDEAIAHSAGSRADAGKLPGGLTR